MVDHVEALRLTGSGDYAGTDNGSENRVTGKSGETVLSGLGGADRINGGGGHNSLLGGNGSDRLTRGDGHDLLKGNGVSDLFIYAMGDGADTFGDGRMLIHRALSG